MGKAGRMTDATGLVARAGMLIRRPAGAVFEAFADPAVTARFWFSKGSGRLEPARGCAGSGRCTAPARMSS